MELSKFLQNHNLPKEVEDNLRKQERDRSGFEVNTGSEKKPYGVGKSFYEQIVADEDTVILGKSYDFCEKKKNPQDDERIDFPKFQVQYSLAEYIRRFYDLPDRKEEDLIFWLQEGVPKQYIFQELPDDGESYKQATKSPENKPILSVYQFAQSDWVKEKDHVVWEENPHQAQTKHIDISPIKDMNSFNWNESDIEDILDVPEKVSDQLGILNLLIKYDLDKEVNDGTLFMFCQALKDIQTSLEEYESSAADSTECDSNQMVANVGGEKYIWQKGHTPDFMGTFNGQNGIKEPFKMIEYEVKSKIHELMDEKFEKNNTFALRELSKFLENLQNLKLFYSESFHMTVNWREAEISSGKSITKGVCPFSAGADNPDTAFITFHRQYLDILRELHEEHNVTVTINYANAHTEEGGMIDRVVDFDEFSIEVEGSLQTNIHHIQQSFAKSRTTQQKKRAIRTIKDMTDSGLVSYKNWGYDEDLYFGNAKGHELDKDSLMVVGTPRKDDWQYGIKHLLINGEFPESGVYGLPEGHKYEKYYIPKLEMKTGFTIDGYQEESLQEVYEHTVLDEKMDAVFRIRKQMSKEKDIYVFDQLPPEMNNLFSDCEWKEYDTYQDLMTKELLPQLVLNSDEDEWDVEYVPSNLPRGLWRDGKKLKKSKNNYDEIEELVFKEVITDIGYLSEEVGCSSKTVKRNSKKNDSIVYVNKSGAQKNYIQRSFDLVDFYQKN